MAVLIGLTAVGCSNSDPADSIDSDALKEALSASGGGSASTVPGSTPGARLTGDDEPNAVVGASPAQIAAAFGAAIDGRDFCAFLAELDDVVTDLEDPAAVIAAYQQLRDSVAAAEPIVDASLSEQWTVLISATAAAARSAERAEGDASDKSLEGVFADPDVKDAIDAIFTWADLRCTSSLASTSTTPAASPSTSGRVGPPTTG